MFKQFGYVLRLIVNYLEILFKNRNIVLSLKCFKRERSIEILAEFSFTCDFRLTEIYKLSVNQKTNKKPKTETTKASFT